MLRGSSPGGLSKWSPAIAKVERGGGSGGRSEKPSRSYLPNRRLVFHYLSGAIYVKLREGGIYINDSLAGGFFFYPFFGEDEPILN